jgi:3-deoxy-D-manno-octulosonic-acid transferase
MSVLITATPREKKKRFEQLDIGNKRLEEMKNIKFQWEKERREKQNKE